MLRTLIHRLFSGGAAAGPADPYFDQTTLLLHGDGTNGAQNNTFLDSSTNNFTITRNGNTTQGTFSPFSQDDGKWGAYFDGSGDTIATASGNALTMGTDDFTAELWIYPTALGVVSTLLDNNWSSSTYSWQIGLSSGNVVQVYNANGAGSNLLVQTTTTISANTWTLISVVKSGTTVTIYLNGVSSASGTMNATFGRDDVNYIGSQNGSTNYFTGYISNVRVVKNSALYSGNFTPSTTPLTAISGTSLLTCQSNRFKDNSANNFAITVNGNTSIQPLSPFAPSAAYSAATNGGSGYFDGSGDSLALPDNAAFDFGTGDYTIEFWLYRNNTTDDMAVIDGRSGTSSGYLIYLGSGNKIIWFVNSGVITGTTTINAGTWYHIAITRSGTSARLFVNGVQDGSATNSTSTDSGAISIGSKSAGASSSSIVNFNGYIANNRIVKGSAVYTSAFTPPTSPVTAISGTSLLLNFTNAGILDNTGRNDLETVGNAQISTSVKKFGTGSILLTPGGGSVYTRAPLTEQLKFDTGDFTIECWIYLITNVAGICAVWSNYSSFSAGSLSLFAGHNSASNNHFIIAHNGGFPALGSTTTVNSVLNTWTHLAVVRYNGQIKLYINGTSEGTPFSSTVALNGVGSYFWVGTTGDSTTANPNCYIDDFRITKGVARYTSNFTPPIVPFEDR